MRLVLGRRQRPRTPERGGVLAEVQRHPLEPGADPDDLARGRELVEQGRLEARDAAPQQVAFPESNGQREPLERDECLPEGRPPVDALPARQEASERARVDGLDLLAQAGQARTTQPAEDIRVAPFALGTAGTQLAADEIEPGEDLLDSHRVEGEARHDLIGGERPAAAREATQDPAQRVLPALQIGVGEPRRRHRAERVPVAPRILGGDQVLARGESHTHRTTLSLECRGQLLVELTGDKVASAQEQVVKLVGRAGAPAKLLLDLVHRVAVDEVAQLFLAEQLLEQVAIERERLGAPLGERRVVLVHVRGDVVEEERRGERRRARRLDLDQVDAALPQSLEQPPKGRKVEDVLEALAERLEHDREVGIAPGDLQEALRLEALLPERGPLAGPAARDQEGAGRVLPEAGAEERGASELGDDEVLELVRAHEQLLEQRRGVCVGQVQRDAVVRPDEVDLEPERLAQACRERERPRRVDACPERREDAQPPVADLVAEALDDDRPVGREHAGRVLLLAEECQEVPGRALVELVLAGQAVARLRVGKRDQLAAGPPDRLAELVRPPDALALPERDETRARPAPARRARGRA